MEQGKVQYRVCIYFSVLSDFCLVALLEITGCPCVYTVQFAIYTGIEFSWSCMCVYACTYVRYYSACLLSSVLSLDTYRNKCTNL